MKTSIWLNATHEPVEHGTGKYYCIERRCYAEAKDNRLTQSDRDNFVEKATKRIEGQDECDTLIIFRNVEDAEDYANAFVREQYDVTDNMWRAFSLFVVEWEPKEPLAEGTKLNPALLVLQQYLKAGEEISSEFLNEECCCDYEDHTREVSQWSHNENTFFIDGTKAEVENRPHSFFKVLERRQPK